MEEGINTETEKIQKQEREYKIFLGKLVSGGIKFYLAGGVAVNVLMGQARSIVLHKDLDILLPLGEKEKVEALLSRKGYSFSEVSNNEEGSTFKILVNQGILLVDIGFLEEDNGSFFVEVTSGGKISRIEVGKEWFSDSPKSFSGIPVETFSPSGLIRCMIAYPRPLREKDITTMKSLRDRFFPGQSLENLKLGIFEKPNDTQA